MTIKDTAVALGLKVRTIRSWIKKGILQAEKRDRVWWINPDVVYSKEVLNRANKGREHSRKIKEGAELGMLARSRENTEKSV